MSHYTTELRFICEELAGLKESAGGNKVAEVIAAAQPKLFDADIPDWNGQYNNGLEQKIMLHYYTREIGFETAGLFKLKLNQRMKEIMPYYNQLYQSETIKFDPLQNIDNTSTHEGIFDGNIDTTGHKDEVGNTNTKEKFNEHIDDIQRDDEHTAFDETKTFNNNDTTNTTEQDVLTLKDTNTVEHGKTVERDYNGEKETTSQTAGADHWVMASDTPQGTLDNARSEQYLSGVQHSTDNAGTTERTMTGGHTDSEGGTTVSKNTGTDTTDLTRLDDTAHRGTIGIDDDTQRDLLRDRDKDTSSSTNTDFTKDFDTDTTGNTKTDNKDQYTNRNWGKVGNETYSEMLTKYRDTFLNIDMMVIRELENLFMQLW